MDIRVSKRPKRRILLGPEDGLRALAERAPQAEAALDRAKEKARPALNWFHLARRRLATGTVAVLTLWLFLHVVLGSNGMVVYRQKKSEYENLQREIDGLQKENDIYTGRIKSLKTDSKAIEKEAREQFHYARPGEVVYVPPPPTPPPATPDSREAKK